MKTDWWGWLAAAFMVAMLGVLWPKEGTRNAMRERIIRVSSEQEIPQVEAESRARSIVLEEIPALLRAGKYPAEKRLPHMIELERLAKYSKFGGHFGANGILSLSRTRAHWQFFGQKDRRAEGERLAQLLKGNKAYEDVSSFVPEETRWHYAPLGAHLLQAYPLTVLLALLYHLCILATRRKSVFSELLVPDRLVKASVLWPIQLWYEAREPREQFRRATHAVVYALSAALCMFLPTSARSQSKEDSGKRRTNNTLQLDFRNTWYTVEGPPDPNLFGRITFYRGRGAAESITTANPTLGRWYNETSLGYAVVLRPGTKVLGMASLSHNNTSDRQLLLGGQVFWAGRWGVFALPVARYEKGLGTETQSLAFVANPMLRPFKGGLPAHFGMTADVQARNTFGKPVSWNVGVGPRFYPNLKKRHAFELVLLQNRIGEWQLRGRTLLEFAF